MINTHNNAIALSAIFCAAKRIKSEESQASSQNAEVASHEVDLLSLLPANPRQADYLEVLKLGLETPGCELHLTLVEKLSPASLIEWNCIRAAHAAEEKKTKSAEWTKKLLTGDTVRDSLVIKLESAPSAGAKKDVRRELQAHDAKMDRIKQDAKKALEKEKRTIAFFDAKAAKVDRIKARKEYVRFKARSAKKAARFLEALARAGANKFTAYTTNIRLRQLFQEMLKRIAKTKSVMVQLNATSLHRDAVSLLKQVCMVSPDARVTPHVPVDQFHNVMAQAWLSRTGTGEFAGYALSMPDSVSASELTRYGVEGRFDRTKALDWLVYDDVSGKDMGLIDYVAREWKDISSKPLTEAEIEVIQG